MYSINLSKIAVIFNSFAICAFDCKGVKNSTNFGPEDSDLQLTLSPNIDYKFDVGLGFFFPKNNRIPNYARIKIPNTSPEPKFTQQTAVTMRLTD